MKAGFWVRALVVAGGVAVVGAVGVVSFWGPRLPAPAADTAADAISADELEKAATHRVFFGHMSVGWNLLSGVSAVYAANGVQQPAITRVMLGDGPPSAAIGTGAILHAEIGVNGDPLGKLANFDAVMRGGMGRVVDIAVLKFCFTDVTSGTDVEAVFAAYRDTMDGLRRDYPSVRFVPTTVPLTIAPSGIRANLKAWLRGDDNAARERYNTLVRQAYGADGLLDLAAVEGTAPDGSTAPSLYPPYSSDGEHLNAAGSAKLAVAFLESLAGGRS